MKLTAKEAANSGPRVRLSRGQVGALGAIMLAYAVLSHYSDSGLAPKGLGVALAFGPVFIVGLVLAWRWTSPWIAVFGAAIVGAVIVRYWGFLTMHYEAADLIEQCGAYSLIAISFAHSMFRTPLCTRLAEELHGPLSSREVTYTHAATIAWALFYLLIATAIALLYFFATRRTWSLFVNFVAFAIIAAACIVDFLLRRWLLPRRSGEDGVLQMLRRALVG